MSDLTVVYYTSNREKPEFESRICRTLSETAAGLPIISVSQKPIDLGRNICVGDVGASSHNAWRQLQIGAAEAKTKFICTAESDFLYPREYFDFKPDREDLAYIVKPLWVLFSQRGKARQFAYKPRGSEAAMVVGRDYLVAGIEKVLDGYGQWGMGSANGDTFPYLLNVINHERFLIDKPTVTFKTDQNMHRRTPHDVDSYRKDLPYWGNIYDLIGKYQ